jgi:hypothetical protein
MRLARPLVLVASWVCTGSPTTPAAPGRLRAQSATFPSAQVQHLLHPPESLEVIGKQALEHVVRLHYTATMKTAVIPQVRVEPELRADLDSVLLPGETLTDFVESTVRNAVEFRRMQTDFAARCDASLANYERTGISVPSDVVLAKLEAKVAARVKQLRK